MIIHIVDNLIIWERRSTHSGEPILTLAITIRLPFDGSYVHCPATVQLSRQSIPYTVRSDSFERTKGSP